MTRRVPGFLLAALVLVSFGCRKAQQKASRATPARLNVVCSFLPIYVIAQNVAQGVPGLSLQLLISPQIGCPHDYAMTPPEAALLEKADVLIMNGLGMEKFLQDSPAFARKNLRVINVAQTIDSLPNPHAWVSPFQAAKITLYVGLQMALKDSAYASIYLANSQKYAAQLDSLGQALHGIVARAVNRRVVTFHDAFDYFARDLGLTILGVIESDPGVEPSPRWLSDLANRMKEARAVAIFSEPQYSDRLARMLSAETGVPVYPLDPAASGPDDPESYLRIMRQNLLTLEKALLVSQ